MFFGLTHATTRADLARAVLEGVAFALADGQDALRAAGTAIGSVSVIGGGARSRFWGRILASALDRPLHYHAGAEVGPAFGAARLARLAVTRRRPGRGLHGAAGRARRRARAGAARALRARAAPLYRAAVRIVEGRFRELAEVAQATARRAAVSRWRDTS